MLSGRMLRIQAGLLIVVAHFLGIAVANAQVSCPATHIALDWMYTTRSVSNYSPGVPASAGTGSSLHEFWESARTQTIADLEAQNPDCAGTISISSSAGVGCAAGDCFQSQALWSCPKSGLNWTAAPSGSIGISTWMVAPWQVVGDGTCFPSTGYNGSTDVAATKTVGECDTCTVGDPITVATGNVFLKQLDYPAAAFGGLEYERYYNSDSGVEAGRLGPGWRHTFDRRVVMSTAMPTRSTYTGPVLAFVYRPDGRVVTFTVSGSVYTPTDPDTTQKLTSILVESLSLL